MLSRPRCRILAAASAVFVAYAGWLLWARDHAPASVADGVYGLIVFNVFALACAAMAGLRSRGAQRVAWLSLSLGFAGMATGDVIHAIYRLAAHSRLPFPSPVDALYLLLPVCVVAATVLAPLKDLRAAIRLLLDGVIVASSLFLIAWSVGLDEVYAARGQAFLPFAVSVAFPIADLVLLTMIVVVVVKAPPAGRPATILMAAGLLVVTATNTAVALLDLRPPHEDVRVALGWAASSLLVGAAGLASRPGKRSDAHDLRAPSRLSPWLPYAPVPFAIVFGLVSIWPFGGIGPVIVGGLILMLAALFRQFTLLDENQRLVVTVADIALRDPLTGLGNRTLFADRLAHAMQLRLRNAAPVAVLLLDLDDFKLINDSFGHSVGDTLLRSVGERIQGSLRAGDTVARLGGDEFAVLIEDDADTAHAVAESVVSAFDDPFVVDGREVFVRPGVGIATALADGARDLTADELFRRADLAMYSAKHDQFRGVRAFTPGMRLDATELQLSSGRVAPGQAEGVDRIRLLGDLRHAVDNEELVLVYQPKFRLATGAIVGVEALIRWPHPTLGMLAPADFLPLVRQSGLTAAVTDLVVSRAVEDAAGWYAAGIEVPVAINLSAPSLDDEALPDHLLAVLAGHHLPAEALAVEITEDLLLASVPRTRTVLERLRQNGIRVAIDDFGSGYAAMTYLRELPIDELKLDRQFVTPILHDPRAAAIVESMIELADTFGIDCVAEGVENAATAERLGEFGCGYVQGHYFSPPVPAEAIHLGIWAPRPVEDAVRRSATTRPSSA